MFIKYLSIKELDLQKSWAIGFQKIKKLPKLEKTILIFWLMGPFIYLIERDPADIWLTVLALAFIIKSIIKNEWDWSRQFWFKACLLFWVTALIAAALSPQPIYSLNQGFVWIRFPIYAAAAQVWLGRDRDIRILMLISMLYGMVLMCLILTLELILQPAERLSWPYGDYVPGGYLAKVCLPIFCVLVAIGSNQNNIKGIYAILISAFTMVISVLTGERTNFLIKICSAFFALIFWRPKILILISVVGINIFTVLFIFISKPDIGQRFTSDFWQLLQVNQSVEKFQLATNSSYNKSWGAWRGGIQQGLETPILGIGPSGTRKTCLNLTKEKYSWLPGKNYCGNHPHNFYIQIFAETGFFGLIFASTMILGIIATCLGSRKKNMSCPMAATAFIIPLALFFPIQQFGSFFGQWGNLFIWFSVGFALSQNQDWHLFKIKKIF